MTTPITIKGTLNPDGTIHVDLPDGWQPGEVTVQVNIEPTFTDEELDELLQPQGSKLGDIDPELIGAGADWDIGDSAEWVEKRRQQRRDKWTE